MKTDGKEKRRFKGKGQDESNEREVDGHQNVNSPETAQDGMAPAILINGESCIRTMTQIIKFTTALIEK